MPARTPPVGPRPPSGWAGSSEDLDVRSTGTFTAWGAAPAHAPVPTTALSVFRDGGAIHVMAAFTSPVTAGNAAWAAATKAAQTSLPVYRLLAQDANNALLGTSQGPYVIVPDSGGNIIVAAGQLLVPSSGSVTATPCPPTATPTVRPPTVTPTATVPRTIKVTDTGPLASVAIHSVIGVGKERFLASSDSIFRSSDVVNSPLGKWEQSRLGFSGRQAQAVVGIVYENQGMIYAAEP